MSLTWQSDPPQARNPWKLMALALAIALALSVALSARADLPYAERIRARTVEVDEIVLKDAAGKVRARMMTDARGAHLLIYDEDGKVISTVPPTPRMMPVEQMIPHK